MEVRLFGYDNPTQRCQDCRDGEFADAGCCDDFVLTEAVCTNGRRCDTFFIYCLRTIGSAGRNCPYFGAKMSTANTNDELIIDFNQRSVLGLDNPLQLQGLTDAYTVSLN